MTSAALWLLVALLMVAGLAGTILPALPGTVLIFFATLLGAWIDDFTRIGAVTLIISGMLMLLAQLLDYAAGVMGARKAGASKEALWGATLGTLVGLFMGLIGIFFMPFVGAVMGEYLARRHHGQSLKVGLFTWLGIMAGLLSKIVIAFMMIGLFAIALWL